jgi:hypothetical protein
VFHDGTKGRILLTSKSPAEGNTCASALLVGKEFSGRGADFSSTLREHARHFWHHSATVKGFRGGSPKTSSCIR